MARRFNELVSKMSPEAQEQVRSGAEAVLLELSLQELRRQHTELTQEDVAEVLSVTQAYVSKFERKGDMLLSTLYAYIRALGGELEVRARVPGHEEVRLTQFEHLAQLAELAKNDKTSADP